MEEEGGRERREKEVAAIKPGPGVMNSTDNRAPILSDDQKDESHHLMGVWSQLMFHCEGWTEDRCTKQFL